tara:strand:+ start:235 stop:939 length:705 start_codon:yes stop_codon:yes gene_type:complete
MIRVDFLPEQFKVAIATSVVVFGFDGMNLRVLLGKKTGEPFEGAWIVPSSIVNVDEDTTDVARGLLKKITGTDNWHLEKLNGFADLYRNPQGRVINMAYYCTVRLDPNLEEILEKEKYSWCNLNEVPSLAFDHNEILDYARERLKRRVKRRPIGFSLLPKEFTMYNIQRLYECALSKNFDKRNFRRKVLKSDLLIETEKKTRSSIRAKRPSKLYKFDEKKYRTLSLKGYDFVYQ